MRIPYAYYMLAGSGRTPPHKSAVKLTAREAAAQGALYPIPGTTEWQEVPDEGRLTVQQPPAEMKKAPTGAGAN